MGEVEKTIEVDLPLRTVYNEWTMFEEFPRFMEGVERVEQLTPDRVRWHARVGRQRRAWDARIIDQIPDRHIVWKAERGEPNSGAVAFRQVDGHTRVALHIEYDPEGIAETAADALGIVSRRVEGDLRRFKEYIEEIGHEAGGWRGTTRPQAEDRSDARRMTARAERALGEGPDSRIGMAVIIGVALALAGLAMASALRTRRQRVLRSRLPSLREFFGFD
ncbi:MAG: SRPBCC family protein [Dehalococcoidia bacterium]|nr:SRPBCC family protein [Dehalococcoidia bacterium]